MYTIFATATIKKLKSKQLFGFAVMQNVMMCHENNAKIQTGFQTSKLCLIVFFTQNIIIFFFIAYASCILQNRNPFKFMKFLGQDISAIYQGALRRGTILFHMKVYFQ